jgi:hypothetical protein
MPLNDADARHLCRRVGFAGRPDEIAHFSGREIDDVVDEVVGATPPLPDRPGFLDGREWWEAYDDAVAWWIGRMVDASWLGVATGGPSPLVERLTLFWHGHFACGVNKVESMDAMWAQNQIFREHGRGDFENLVQLVSVSSAMLRYIDNETNVKGAEQENFARELMELHTIGVGNFTEADVIAMAKAWTGHNIVGWYEAEPGVWRLDMTYRFFPEHHDDGDKTLFGITRNWDGPETVTELVQGSKQQQTARFVATKMWKFFVNSNPTASQLDTVAAEFVAGDMGLASLLRAILRHPDFWAPANRRAIVRSPIEWVVDVLKRTGVPRDDIGFGWLLPATGQTLFEPPNVAGWGTHGYWVSTAGSWGKGRFASSLRWHDHFDTRFAGLSSLDRAAAVDYLLGEFGISDASAHSRDRLGAWFDAAKARHRWSLKHNAVVITALLPEMQVA